MVHYSEHITIDNLIVKVKEGAENPYSVLNNYAALCDNADSGSTCKPL